MGKYRPAAAAIFDVDGLLLDTETIYTEITRRIVGRFGRTYDWSIKGNMIGRPQLDSARYLVETLSLPISAEEYLEERNEMLRPAFSKCGALPGAERLVHHLSKNAIPIAVATSSSNDLFEIKISRHKNWFALFDQIVTADDPEVKNGKPAPDIFSVAAKRLNTRAEDTLVFEDAPSGLRAGIAAGMRVISVPDSNMDRKRYQGSEQILDSLLDFSPELFGLGAISGP